MEGERQAAGRPLTVHIAPSAHCWGHRLGEGPPFTFSAQRVDLTGAPKSPRESWNRGIILEGPLTLAHAPTGFFEMKMKYDESDNALIRASRALTDKVTDLLGEWLARPCHWGRPREGRGPSTHSWLGCLQGACSPRPRCRRCSRRSCELTLPSTRSGSCSSVRTTSSPTSWRWVAPQWARPVLPYFGHPGLRTAHGLRPDGALCQGQTAVLASEV